MRLANSQQTKRVISLTPLIDVVFLLLVFFMLASTFLKFGTVKLETAGAGLGTVAPADIVLVHVAGEGRLTVNGMPTDATGVVDLINARVAEGAKSAALVSREKATVSDLVSALRLVRGTNVESVRIID